MTVCLPLNQHPLGPGVFLPGAVNGGPATCWMDCKQDGKNGNSVKVSDRRPSELINVNRSHIIYGLSVLSSSSSAMSPRLTNPACMKRQRTQRAAQKRL